MTYELIGAQLSYYSGKARAYLRWKGVDFVETLPRAEIIQAIGWSVIPVLRLPDGTLVQDTLDIIETVEAREGGTPIEPEDPTLRALGRVLHLLGDEWLLIPAMHYRWHYNEDFALSEFGKTAAPGADPDTQLAVGTKHATMFRGVVPMLGITPETIPAVEASYEALLADLDAHFTEHAFLLGGRPTLADFGFYGPLYAHLYRDPASGEVMRRIAPNVAAWVERLLTGEYISGPLADSGPETLKPVLQRLLSEHIPVLEQTAAHFAAWADSAASGTELPRAFGMVATEVDGTHFPTIARSFSLLRLQHVQAGESGRLEDWLPDTKRLRQIALAKPLERVNYRLCLA